MGDCLLGAVWWLNKNSGAVTAVVTAIYTIVTILLWVTTKRQADLTRTIFEATHRPHISIEPEIRYPAHPGFIRLELKLRNHGSVPAQVTAWAATFRREDNTVLSQSEALSGGLCVFPSDAQDAPFLRIDGGAAEQVWDTPVYLHALVGYSGDAPTPSYSTAMQARFRITGAHEFRIEEVQHQVV